MLHYYCVRDKGMGFYHSRETQEGDDDVGNHTGISKIAIFC